MCRKALQKALLYKVYIMKYFKYILFIGILMIIYGCKPFSNQKETISFKKEYELRYKAYDNELMFAYANIGALDSFLVLVSNQPDSFCTAYSIGKGMKETCQYGIIGNGPEEFLQPMLTYAFGNVFILNDLNKGELALMKLHAKQDTAFIQEEKKLKIRKQRKDDNRHFYDIRISRLDANHYVSYLGMDKGQMFGLFDDTLTPMSEFGESPIPEELSPAMIFMRLNGPLATYNGAMAFTLSDLPYLCCYKLVNGQMEKQCDFFFDKPYYAVRNGDILYDRDKTFGSSLGLVMDEHFIYVLYLDQLLSEYNYKDPEKSFANKILIFDYKGTPIARLKLDCRIQSMALSADHKKLYGIANIPEPTLVEFELPNLHEIS